MSAAFTDTPNSKPYTAIRPCYDMSTVNSSSAPLAGASAGQDLSEEDRIDEQTFNEAIWKSVKGADSPLPQIQHQVFGGAATPVGSSD
jgi:hypothetical protein